MKNTTPTTPTATADQQYVSHVQDIWMAYRYLVWAATCFTLGFWATNIGFSGTSASFVETIKAAEPMTSATLSVNYGLEVLGWGEISSLATIMGGVVLSTVGNTAPTTATTNTNDNNTAIWASLVSCAIVMTSNILFSCRGLFQKLWSRQITHLTTTIITSTTTTHHHHHLTTTIPMLDNVNLQYRMQQWGVTLLIVPTIIWQGPYIIGHLYMAHVKFGLITSGLAWNYLWLALINGLAFTSYNLASTFLLSRISVVHHAALNCIRRIFAILVTSVVFGVPITVLGGCGIAISFTGFMSFSYFKAQKKTTTTTTTSLTQQPTMIQQPSPPKNNNIQATTRITPHHASKPNHHHYTTAATSPKLCTLLPSSPDVGIGSDDHHTHRA